MHTSFFKLLAMAVLALSVAACGDDGNDNVGPPPPQPQSKSTTTQGVITGFGSVFVNGVEFETAGAEIEIDDESGGTEGDLAVGQKVTVKGERDEAGNNTATRIEFDPEIEGPISSIDTASDTFIVLGQTVAVGPFTSFEDAQGLDDLQVNDFVEVSGFFDNNGVLVATFVERKAPEAEVEVKGFVQNLNADNKTFQINALTVDFSGAELDPPDLMLENGLFVEAEGVFVAATNTLNATEIEQEEPFEAEEGDEVELLGFVSAVNSSTEFVLNGVTVQHGPNTEFENGTAADIAVDEFLEVEGTIDANGVLQAEEIEFEEKPFIEIEADAQAVDTDARTITVLGITVQVTDATELKDERDEMRPFTLADIQPGDHLEIGAGDDAGQTVAFRIEREEADEEVELRGDVTSEDPDNNVLVVRGVAVDVSNAEFSGEDESPKTKDEFFQLVAPGDIVEAEGTADGNTLIADKVEIKGDDDSSSGG